MTMEKFSRRGLIQILTASAALCSLPRWVVASTKVPAKWDETAGDRGFGLCGPCRRL